GCRVHADAEAPEHDGPERAGGLDLDRLRGLRQGRREHLVDDLTALPDVDQHLVAGDERPWHERHPDRHRGRATVETDRGRHAARARRHDRTADVLGVPWPDALLDLLDGLLPRLPEDPPGEPRHVHGVTPVSGTTRDAV